MKRNIFYYVTSLIIGVILFSSCSGDSEKEKLNGLKLVPNDAVAALEVNVEEFMNLLEKSQREEITSILENYMDEFPMPIGMKKKIKEILNNPQNLGIKLGEPIYTSVKIKDASFEEDPYFYISGTLSNVEKFESTIGAIMSISPENYNEIKYFDLEDMYIFYDGDAFLATVRTSRRETPENIKNRVGEIFNQGKYFSETEVYKLMKSQQGLAKVGVNFAPFWDTKEFKNGVKNEMPFMRDEIEEMKNTSLAMALNIKDGEASLKYNIKCNSPKFKEAYEQVSSAIGKIEGEHIKYINKNETFVAFTNIDAEKILDYAEEQLSDLLSDDDFSAFKKYISSINGDITFKASCSKLFGGDQIPEMVLYCSTDNNSIVEQCAYEAGLTPYLDNIWYKDYTEAVFDEYYNYLGSQVVAKAYVGYNDGISYFSFGDNPSPFNRIYSTYDVSKFTDKSIYACLNIRSLVRELRNQGVDADKNVNIVLSVLENIESVEAFSNEPILDFELKLFMKDKSKNPVESIAEEALSMLK